MPMQIAPASSPTKRDADSAGLGDDTSDAVHRRIVVMEAETMDEEDDAPEYDSDDDLVDIKNTYF